MEVIQKTDIKPANINMHLNERGELSPKLSDLDEAFVASSVKRDLTSSWLKLLPHLKDVPEDVRNKLLTLLSKGESLSYKHLEDYRLEQYGELHRTYKLVRKQMSIFKNQTSSAAHRNRARKTRRLFRGFAIFFYSIWNYLTFFLNDLPNDLVI